MTSKRFLAARTEPDPGSDEDEGCGASGGGGTSKRGGKAKAKGGKGVIATIDKKAGGRPGKATSAGTKDCVALICLDDVFCSNRFLHKEYVLLGLEAILSC